MLNDLRGEPVSAWGAAFRMRSARSMSRFPDFHRSMMARDEVELPLGPGFVWRWRVAQEQY
jgi:hypothetical protein